MINLPDILFAIGFLLILQLLVISATQRTLALRPWQALLSALALAWWLLPFIKKAYVDAVFYPDDSVVHEEMAREIAYLLSNGDWQYAMEYFGFGNEGYRFILGCFYAITGVTELTTYGMQGLFGFWGMLSLLELICIQVSARRIPLWIVLFTMANPSAVFWTTFNLKEGAMLWGICMLLRTAVRSGDGAAGVSVPNRASLAYRTPAGPLPAQKPSSERFWPFMGLLTAGFLRPHIVVAYLVALSVGVAVRQRKIGMAIGTAVGMVALLTMLKTMAPVIFERLTAEGVGTTLTERFHELNSTGGSAITYARGAPIPLISGFVLINLRPFPWEVTDITTIAAGAEIWLITATSVFNWYRMQNRRRLLKTSYVITLLVVVLALSFYFTYMYNMGLMARQRVMAFPALVSLAVFPAAAIANRRTAVRSRSATPFQRPLQVPRPVYGRRPSPGIATPVTSSVSARGRGDRDSQVVN